MMGGSYMISQKAVSRLLAAVSTTPYFKYEDVYLTGLCSPKAGVQLESIDRFFVIRPAGLPDPCFVRDTVSWHSDADDGMLLSHLAVVSYFKKKLTQC